MRRQIAARDPLGKDEASRTAGSLTIRQQTKGTAMYRSNTAVYIDADDNVVAEDDPKAAFMLVAAGGEISEEKAAKYGLKGTGDKPVEREHHDNTLTPRELKLAVAQREQAAPAFGAKAEAKK